MSLSRSIILTVIVLTGVVVSCNVLKKEESNENIQAFVTSFQSSLALSDAEILKQFDTRQSSESILAAVRILQNKESAYFECVASFQEATIVRGESDTIKVVIPAVFNAKNLEETADPVQTSLTLSIQKKKNEFVIVQLRAEEFYNAYATLKNQMEWSVQRQQAIDLRAPIYQKAKQLQINYDSVIWYATYDKKNYFYVVKGEWKTDPRDPRKINSDSGYSMGLIDEMGTVIVPVEYDLIGTIGFDYSSVVEIKKNGKVGYFNIESKKVMMEPVYDMIIPYGKDDILMLARKDSVKGWINNSYGFEPGFPTVTSEEWFDSFGFLSADVKVTAVDYSLCEIPNSASAGYGVFIPPSYLVATGMFDQLVVGISTTPFPLNGWTEYVETKGTLFERITDKLNAVVTTINERYLEGREEFYTHNRLVFVDANNNPITISDIRSDDFVHIKRMSDSLIEVKSAYTSMDFEMEGESELSVYTYFALNEEMIVTELTSNRSHPSTEFVKLDSTYLTGKFSEWNHETETIDQYSFAPLSVLKNMRDEILASYGYIFPEEHHYSDTWYKPRYNTIEEFQDQLTEIDKYNLEFLERIIGLMQAESA